jgi:hypothetical protein
LALHCGINSRAVYIYTYHKWRGPNTSHRGCKFDTSVLYSKISKALLSVLCIQLAQVHSLLDRSHLLLKLRNPIEVERSTDERQMREGLRRIAQLLTTPGNLLGEHHEVVGEAQHVLKQVDSPNEVLGFVDTRARHGFYKPEGAHAEGAFAATDTCVC